MARRPLAKQRGVPPHGDSSWPRWCEPIREFIYEHSPTWEELLRFGSANLDVDEDVLKQRVAWLEGRKKVVTFPTHVERARAPVIEEEKWHGATTGSRRFGRRQRPRGSLSITLAEVISAGASQE